MQKLIGDIRRTFLWLQPRNFGDRRELVNDVAKRMENEKKMLNTYFIVRLNINNVIIALNSVIYSYI